MSYQPLSESVRSSSPSLSESVARLAEQGEGGEQENRPAEEKEAAVRDGAGHVEAEVKAEADDFKAGLIIAVSESAPLKSSDVHALEAEHALEEHHTEQVEAQLEAQAETRGVKEEGEGEVDGIASPSSPSSVPLPPPDLVPKPTAMDIDELKTHMAEIGERVNRDVIEMERNQQTGPIITEQHIIIEPGKHDKLIRTLFGFTLHCKCLINDEVRMTIWILLCVGAITGIILFILDVDVKSFDPSTLRLHERFVAILVGGIFSLLATILSIIQIRAHHNHWIHPPSQRCVVRILMMVPVYSISAWLSLVFLQYSLYIDFIRTCYEAFVIYTFMILLTKYLGGHNGVVEWMKTKPPLTWPSPFCCFPAVKPGNNFLYWLKYGTLQYTIISPIITVIAMVLDFFNLYQDGDVSFSYGYVYISFVQNFTQLTSLYCLVWLYVAMKNELAPFSPMAKFLVVKSVVFFTFWQSVGLAILVKASVIQSTAELDVGQIQVGLQDFIVCIEMFIAAAVHKYTFGWETYANGTMKLLMDQRAMYLAKMSYERAQEEQKRQEALLLKEERRKLGLDSEEEEAEANGLKKKKTKKKKKKGKGKAKRKKSVRLVDQASVSVVPSNDDVTIDVYPPRPPMLNPALFSGDDDDDAALVDVDALSEQQNTRLRLRSHDGVPPSPIVPFSMERRSSVSETPKSLPSTPASQSSFTPHFLSQTVPSFSSSLSHMRRGSAHALNALSSTAATASKTLISSTKSVIAPVSRLFVNPDDDCLFDEDVEGKKPIMLTEEMRREIEEQARKEKEMKDRRKRETMMEEQRKRESRQQQQQQQQQQEQAPEEEEMKNHSEHHQQESEMVPLSEFSPVHHVSRFRGLTSKLGNQYERVSAGVDVDDEKEDSEANPFEEDPSSAAPLNVV